MVRDTIIILYEDLIFFRWILSERVISRSLTGRQSASISIKNVRFSVGLLASQEHTEFLGDRSSKWGLSCKWSDKNSRSSSCATPPLTSRSCAATNFPSFVQLIHRIPASRDATWVNTGWKFTFSKSWLRLISLQARYNQILTSSSMNNNERNWFYNF